MRRCGEQRLERLRAHARRPSHRGPPRARPSARRRARNTRPGTARASRSFAASPGRAPRRRADSRHPARRRAAGGARVPIRGCTRAAAIPSGRSTRARGRASGRRHRRTVPGLPLATSAANASSMSRTTSRSPARTCASKSAGAGLITTCWRSRKAISAGARSAPATGRSSSRDLSDWLATRLRISTRKSGPEERGQQRHERVRRSRRVSTISLRATVATRESDESDRRRDGHATLTAALARNPATRRTRPRATGAPDCATSSAAVPRRDDLAVAEDHDPVAQRGDFLHHVRAEEQALAPGRAGVAGARAARACS